MFRENALIPSDAIRLAALGVLAQGPRRYADLAADVRHFISRLTGPSLDLMGSSLELLRYEGLIEPVTDQGTSPGYTDPDTQLRITEAGRDEMTVLLCTPVRGPINDINRLFIALKMRFLHLLEKAERTTQVDMLVEICEAELIRLNDLRERDRDPGADLADWLDHEIGQVRERLDWFRTLRQRL